MLKFIKIFLIAALLYHILVTILCYGFFWEQCQQMSALAREGIWLAFILIVMIVHRKDIAGYLKQWKYPWIAFWVLLIFGIGISLWQGKSWGDMIIGIKYGFWFLGIFLTASFVGHVLAKAKESEQKMSRFWTRIMYVLLGVVVIGFVRQGAKLIFPDRFMSIGYGPLNDFFYGIKPPLYYLTGLGGTLRRQGIFAGPNNYGYFLVALLPVILWITPTPSLHKEGKWKWILPALRIITIFMTLSRAAAVGLLVVLAIMYRKRILSHKKIALWISIVFILGIVGLSVLKWTSTLAHITAKFSSLKYVIDQPLGYGLGSSGPAVHHHGDILPENYFIQVMLDVGTVGFLIFLAVLFFILQIIKKIPQQSSLPYLMRRWLTIGWVALLVMGMFLHVFEDSMVNYRFFILRGVMTGWMNKKISQ